MKLLIRDFVGSLKERNELDAILPDLLSEAGYTVFSRPGIGTTQFGVDIAAVGPDEDGERKVFLLTVKPGDLTRHEWHATPQGVRASLSEIQDVYIPNRIPSRYQHLKVVICICVGGDIQEPVRDVLTAYENTNQTERVTFEEWNGDFIAQLVLSGLLRERFLPNELRRSFQKSIAMVDEPEVAYAHFRELAIALKRASGDSKVKRVRAARQLYLAVWVLYVWAAEADNVDASYRASEFAILLVWELLRPFIGKRTKDSRAIVRALEQLIQLHIRISFEFLETKILPHVKNTFALSAAVNSRHYADVNLRLFELLGRFSMAVIWVFWSTERGGGAATDTQPEKLAELAHLVVDMIASNPALLTPLKDDHAIEVALTWLLFALARADRRVVEDWVSQSSVGVGFAIRTHSRYPTISQIYRDIFQHPRERTEEFRKTALPGSVLLPLYAVLLAAHQRDDEFEALASLIEEELPACTLQFWLPDDRTEDALYEGGEHHGSTLTDISLADGPDGLLESIWEATEEYAAFNELTCMSTGYWPILLIACRHHRLPIPPQFWIRIVRSMRDPDWEKRTAATSSSEDEDNP